MRLSDKHLEGTGIPVSVSGGGGGGGGGGCVLRVGGLTPNKEYVFAVSAHGARGQLIGSCVGATSRPLLARHTLPLTTAWGLLCQVRTQHETVKGWGGGGGGKKVFFFP